MSVFLKDSEDDTIISRLIELPIIFNDIVYDLMKMDERDFKDHVMKIHEVQKPKRKELEKAYKVVIEAKKVVEENAKAEIEKRTKAIQQVLDDAAKVTKVFIDLTIEVCLCPMQQKWTKANLNRMKNKQHPL